MAFRESMLATSCCVSENDVVTPFFVIFTWVPGRQTARALSKQHRGARGVEHAARAAVFAG